MPDRTLLVPGTQASTLVDQHGSTVYDAVRCGFNTMLGAESKALEGGYPPEVWHDLMGMEHQLDVWMPIRTSLLDGVSLTEGEVVRTPYDRIWGMIDVPWPYDWRGDLRYNALRLLRWLEDHRPPEGGRWNLIGHSQGALIIVVASKLTQRVDDFARLVARVVLVGGPLAGTMRALEALLWGSTGLGKSDERVVSARKMARTWPALYQMLPAWPAVLGPDGKQRPVEEQFLDPGGWPGDCGEGIQPHLLIAARETQHLLAGPFSRFGTGVAARAVQGRSQVTPITLERDGDELPTDRKDMESEKGDSLVPDEMTRTWGGLPFQALCVTRTRLKRHAFLLEDEWVVEAIDAFLEADAPPPPPLP